MGERAVSDESSAAFFFLDVESEVGGWLAGDRGGDRGGGVGTGQ